MEAVGLLIMRRTLSPPAVPASFRALQITTATTHNKHNTHDMTLNSLIAYLALKIVCVRMNRKYCWFHSNGIKSCQLPFGELRHVPKQGAQGLLGMHIQIVSSSAWEAANRNLSRQITQAKQ